jgi:thiol-disulfide isomerase/thioredoxin
MKRRIYEPFQSGLFIALALVALGPGGPAPDSEHRSREGGKMIDKSTRRDYEGSRHQRDRFIWIIGAALIWALLGVGIHPAAAQVQDGNPGRGGEALEIKSLLSRDRTTALDFFSPYCYPCVQMTPVLEKLAARMPEVLFVRVNINRPEVTGIDWKSPLVQQYRIRSVPYFMIFNPQGKVVAEGPAARQMIQGWLQKAGLGQQTGK